MRIKLALALALAILGTMTSHILAASDTEARASHPRIRSAVQRSRDRWANRSLSRHTQPAEAPLPDAPLPDDDALENAPLPDDPPPSDDARMPDESEQPNSFPPLPAEPAEPAADEVPADAATSPTAPADTSVPSDTPREPYLTPRPADEPTPPGNAEATGPGELATADWLGGAAGLTDPCGEDCCDSCCDSCCGPASSYRLYFIGEALFLNLSRPGYRALAEETTLDGRLTSTTTVLSTRNLDPGSGVGPRLRLGWLFGAQSSVELSYFGLNYWNATNQATAAGALSLPGPLAGEIPGFSSADQITAGYAATIQNAEANYLHRLGASNWQLLCGFRYLGFNEKLHLVASSTHIANDYAINVHNQLYGLQCGSRYLVQFWRVGLEAIGKAGLYGNDALQRSKIGPGNDAQNWLVLDRSGGNLAFVGELGLNGIAQITNWLYVRGGYNLLWVQGIARAADQLSLTTSAGATVESAQAGSLVHNRGAFLHGASVGAEIRW
ncbi:MAG: BBP7 family outer membrane beta-barrel protein [Pirellulales bacterium]|nr:BBP7 family outer membrane beta-barrel protein [Pirellulales bacterium]